MTLGQVFREARARAGLSLREVEKRVGISNGYLSLLESDSVKNPSPKHLHALSELYGTSYSLLMELAGYAVPEVPATSLPELLREAEDLSADEWTQVRTFVGYLRASRNTGTGEE